MTEGPRVRLRDKRVTDARYDYNWQTDPELARLDATTQLTVSFARYLLDYAWEVRFPSPRRRRFAIETLDGEHIGNCSYYDINEAGSEAELGIIIGSRDHWGKGYGTSAVTTLVDHIFQVTKLGRIYLKTLDSNARAQRCFEKCGFKRCGCVSRDGHDFVLMEMYREQWQERQTET